MAEISVFWAIDSRWIRCSEKEAELFIVFNSIVHPFPMFFVVLSIYYPCISPWISPSSGRVLEFWSHVRSGLRENGGLFVTARQVLLWRGRIYHSWQSDRLGKHMLVIYVGYMIWEMFMGTTVGGLVPCRNWLSVVLKERLRDDIIHHYPTQMLSESFHPFQEGFTDAMPSYHCGAFL